MPAQQLLYKVMTSSNGNIFRVTGPLWGESTGHKGQWHRALMFLLICAWTNGWEYNRNVGEMTCSLWRHFNDFTPDEESLNYHYNDVIMGTIASQITSLTIVYSASYANADQRKHQSSASLAFVRGIHWGPVNSLHKWPVTRKMFPFGDIIMMIGWANNTAGKMFCVWPVWPKILCRFRI